MSDCTQPPLAVWGTSLPPAVLRHAKTLCLCPDADGGAPVAPGPATAKTVDEFLDGAFGGGDDSQSDDDEDAPVSDYSDLELEHEVVRGVDGVAVLFASSALTRRLQDGGGEDDELPDADHSDSGALFLQMHCLPHHLKHSAVSLQTRSQAGGRPPPWRTCVPPTRPSARSCPATSLTWRRSRKRCVSPRLHWWRPASKA